MAERPIPNMPRIAELFAGTKRAEANEWAKHCKALYGRVRELEETLRAADEALEVMWRSYDRGDHGGSPGEWIAETMDQMATAIRKAQP